MHGVTRAQLPAGWTTRRPTLDDLDTILAVVHASDIASVGEPDFSPEDVREALFAPNVDPARDSWLAMDPTGAVVAWAYLENPKRAVREFAEVYVHPERGLPAQAPLLDLLLARTAERAAEFGYDPITVRAGAVPTEQRWADTLRAAGFAFHTRYSRMRRGLDGIDPTPPPPPPGVAIRPVRHDDEAELRLFHHILDTAFRDTTDHQPSTYEQWRAQLDALPSIAWDEWFLATVDGEPAGVLQSADQAHGNNEGWVKNLAVLREHRRRGVGGALLARAFATYAAKGCVYAGLGVHLENPTAPASLYRSMGMTALYSADLYERQVAAAG
jgi:mycothiol synthase